MAKLQQLLNEEIRKQAHKELGASVRRLREQLAALRDQVHDLNNRLKVLEKAQPETDKKAEASLPATTGKAVRVTPDRIKKWRGKLGLTQSQYAALLGVNILSVNHWESGKAVPRDEWKQRIAWLRELGKREIRKLLAEKNISPVKKTSKRDKKGSTRKKKTI